MSGMVTFFHQSAVFRILNVYNLTMLSLEYSTHPLPKLRNLSVVQCLGNV